MAEQSIVEQRRLFREGFKKRMQNLADIGESAAEKGVDIATGIVKEELFGIPGMLADLAPVAQYVTNPFTYGTNEALQKATDDLVGEFGAQALAEKAGVELSDDFFDENGQLRDEMVGRMLAPGALVAKGFSISKGLVDLVPSLKASDFFPAGGPQLNPVTVAPDPRTTFPMDDAPLPDTSVMLNEARGVGSDIGDLIASGEIKTPEDITRVMPEYTVLNPKDFPDQEAFEYAERAERYKLINQFKKKEPKEKKVKTSSAPRQETYMVGEEGASLIGDAHSPLLDVLKKMDIPSGGITGSDVVKKVNNSLTNRRNVELNQYGLAAYLSKNADRKFSRDELLETFDTLAPNIDVKTVMEADLQSSAPDLSYQTPDGVSDAAGRDGHGVIVFGNKKGAELGGVKLKGIPGHDYFKDDVDGFFGQLRFSIVPDPYNPGSSGRYMALNEFQSDLIRGLTDLAEGRDTEYSRRIIADERQPLTPGERLALKDIDTKLANSDFQNLERKLTEVDAQRRAIEESAEYRLGGMSNAAPSKNRSTQQKNYDNLFRAVSSGMHKMKSEEAVTDFLSKNFPNLDENSVSDIKNIWTASNILAKDKLSQGIGSAKPGLVQRMMGETDILPESQREELIKTLQEKRRTLDRAKFFEDISIFSDDIFKAYTKGVNPGDWDVVTGTGNKTFIDPKTGKKVAGRGTLEREDIIDALPNGWYDRKVKELANTYKQFDKQFRGGVFPARELKGLQPALYGRPSSDSTSYERSARAELNQVLDWLGGKVPATAGVPGEARNYINNKNRYKHQESRLEELMNIRPEEDAVQLAKDKFYKDLEAEGGIGDLNEVLALRDKTIASGGSKGYMQDVPFKTQASFNQFALRAAVREAEKLGLDGVVVPDWADMSVMGGRLSEREFLLGSQLEIEAPAFNQVTTKIDEVAQRDAEEAARVRGEEDADQFKSDYIRLTDMKEILDDVDEKARDTILQLFDLRPSKESTDGEEILKRYYNPQLFNESTGLGAEALENIDEDTLINISSLKKGMEERITYGMGQTKRHRAFKTNYGDVLDAGLQRLISEGVEVEVKPFGLYNPRENKIEPFGEVKRPSRVIELKGKTKDIAKKVPSAYNKGGHVDVRGGIGAMAREVM